MRWQFSGKQKSYYRTAITSAQRVVHAGDREVIMRYYEIAEMAAIRKVKVTHWPMGKPLLGNRRSQFRAIWVTKITHWPIGSNELADRK